MLKMDKKTKKWYYNNVQCGKLVEIKTVSGNVYRIFALCKNEDCWYNDEFMGTDYAVFKKIKNGNFWQQISKWYMRYGDAVRCLSKSAKE